MAISNGLRYLHLAFLARPTEDRPLYRAIGRNQVRRIVEIGVGSVERAVRMMRLASQFDVSTKLRYTGLDLFELRDSSAEPLSLKEVHRRLRGTDAQVKLVPGIPAQSLVRVANSLMNTDLVLISAAEREMVADAASYYLPRLLHDNSMVFEERIDAAKNTSKWHQLSPFEIQSRVKQPPRAGRRVA